MLTASVPTSPVPATPVSVIYNCIFGPSVSPTTPIAPVPATPVSAIDNEKKQVKENVEKSEKKIVELEKLFDEAYNQIMQDENNNRNNENYKLLSLNQKREKALSMAEIQMMKILKKGG